MIPVICIGYDNFLVTEKIVGVFDSTTSQAKSIIKESTKVLDVTRKSKCRSYIYCSGGVIIKSPLSPKTIKRRIYDTGTKEEDVV